jgi:HK97 family phage prohead protease
MGYRVANEQMGMQVRDVWTTAYVNDLPDSSFLYIAPGGTKKNGKTDGAHRYFPVKDAAGKVDAAHLRNALAQIPKASTLSADVRAKCMQMAKDMAEAHPTVGGPAGTYAGSAGSGRDRMPAEVMGLQTRRFDLVMELRADGDGRTLIGRAVPYGQTAEIPGGTERFVMGAFSRQIAGGQVHAVKLHASHSQRLDGGFAIGKTVALSEQQDGLHGAWQLYDTARGDEALHLVKTGEVSGLSIGFKALDGGTRRGRDGAYERHAAHLDHVVLTTEPAYAGAQVMAVRGPARPVAAYRTDLLRARRILDRVTSAL